MTIPECDVRLMVVDLAIIRGRVRKLIRVGDLATSHILDQMQSVKMLRQRTTWMRENTFSRIEVIDDRHKETLRRMRAGFDPEPIYTGIYNP